MVQNCLVGMTFFHIPRQNPPSSKYASERNRKGDQCFTILAIPLSGASLNEYNLSSLQ